MSIGVYWTHVITHHVSRITSYQSVSIEIDAQHFALAKKAIPQLAALYPAF